MGGEHPQPPGPPSGLPSARCKRNLRLYAHAEAFVHCCFDFYNQRKGPLLLTMAQEVVAVAESIAKIGPAAEGTARKLRDGANALAALASGDKNPNFGNFPSLFGRCQQYLSLIRVR